MSSKDDIVQDNCSPDGQSGSTVPSINIKIRSVNDVNVRKVDRRTDDSHTFFSLIPKEKVVVGKSHVGRKYVQSKLDTIDKAELERIALITINNRIEFCQKYKKTEEEIGKCVCESLRRYIRLSKESREKNISKVQINAIKKMFEEMKKNGKIKTAESI